MFRRADTARQGTCYGFFMTILLWGTRNACAAEQYEENWLDPDLPPEVAELAPAAAA
jgi:hypothetical protein